MGGRGSASGFVSRLPNYKNAVVLQRKVKNYILNPQKSNGKFAIFAALGYNMGNSKRLEADMREGLKHNKALRFSPNKYGNVAYEVVMELGITTRAKVVTAWQIDNGDNKPRFITAYKFKGD